MGISIQSKVVRKVGFQNVPYFQVKQIVKGSGKKERVFTDCEHFTTRQAALNAIPELDRDLKDSIEQGVF